MKYFVSGFVLAVVAIFVMLTHSISVNLARISQILEDVRVIENETRDYMSIMACGDIPNNEEWAQTYAYCNPEDHE